MIRSLQGKIADVTGASTGIGLAIAKRFVAEGATVIRLHQSYISYNNVDTVLGEMIIHHGFGNFAGLIKPHGKIRVKTCHSGRRV